MKNACDKLMVQLAKELKNKNYVLVTVESCTGGYLAYLLSKNPDCSTLLERGYVTYSNMSKKDLLNVSDYTLQMLGAVSSRAAKEMAEGALKKSNAQMCVATTGLAGEDNKSSSTKEGIVWIGCAGVDKKTVAYRFKLKGSRRVFMEKACEVALQTLISFINK